MRKWIPLTAAALLMMSSLTGCFGNDEESSVSEGHTEEISTNDTNGDTDNEVRTDDQNVVDELVTDAGDAVEDIVTDAENMVDDITPDSTNVTDTSDDADSTQTTTN